MQRSLAQLMGGTGQTASQAAGSPADNQGKIELLNYLFAP